MNISIISEDDLPVEKPDVISTDVPRKCKCDVDEELILKKLTAKYNITLRTFFKGGAFNNQLQSLVKNELHDMALNESSAHNTTMIDSNHNTDKADVEERLLTLENNMKRVLQELDLKNKQLEEKDSLNKKLLDKIKNIEEQKSPVNNLPASNIINEDIKERLESLQLDTAAVQADINVLKKFEKELDHLRNEVLSREALDADTITTSYHNIDSQLKNLHEWKKEMKKLHDELEQYGRRDILEFWGIRQRDGENTTHLVLDFLDSVLGLKLSKYDISVSHRQRHARSSRDNAPDPIYVKFVNRSIKHDILYLKKKLFNRIKQTDVFICENLTLRRRELLATARQKLQSFKFIWVKEGIIFARKSSKARVHKIENFDIIERLSKVAT